MSTRIIVKNIPKNIKEEQLKKHFSQKGEITDVKIMKKENGQSRNFCFIGFKDEKSAKDSVKYFNQTYINTSKILVEIAKLQGDPSLKKKGIKEKKNYNKKNRFLFSQERYIVITNYAIYNLKGKSLKRRIDISKLKGITNSEKTLEFVLHGNEEYDYLYYSENKLIIIHIIEKIYEVLMGKTLLFTNLETDNLKSKVTTKKEKEKNQNFSRMDDTNLTDINEFLKKKGFGEEENYPELETENNEINLFDSSQSLYFRDSLMSVNKRLDEMITSIFSFKMNIIHYQKIHLNILNF